jgi:nicotinamide-nucleotide amidase
MKSAIISIGTELLFGQIVNTNTVFLSRELNNMGIDVIYHYGVGDNPERLKSTVSRALEDCDLIITTGGLGPTQDDLTEEVICEMFGEELVFNEDVFGIIEKSYDKMGIKITENTRKTATVPRNAIIFANSAGFAPGIALEKNEKIIICLPGPPIEMETIFNEEVKPYLSKNMDATIFSRSLMIYGMGESRVETEMEALIKRQTDPTLATYLNGGCVEVRITSKRASEKEAREAVEEVVEKSYAILGDYIYSSDGKQLYEVVGEKLIEKGITLSSAESCTGGLFAAAITNTPGISAVFDRGLVTYTAGAKIDELGVQEDTIEKYGTVSSQTAEEMASGLAAKTGSRMNIAVTGVAGPDSSENKPVGLYYIGINFDGKSYCKEYFFNGRTRAWNRNFILLKMLDCINRLIDGKSIR